MADLGTDKRIPVFNEADDIHVGEAPAGGGRSALAAQEIDMQGDSIKTDTITGNTVYTIVNPEIGRLVILEVDGLFTITLPGTVTVINGDYVPAIGTNHLHLYCVDAVTPAYLGSWTTII